MRAMQRTVAERRENPLRSQELVFSSVAKSLMPLIFNTLDHSGRPPISAFFCFDALPRTAELLCKFSGLLLQAYWYILKQSNRQAEIPGELDYLVSQIWGGHLAFTEGTALSLLREACMAPESSGIRSLVNSPHVFEQWGELLRHRGSQSRYKEIVNISTGADWYVYFSQLLKALPILKLASCESNQFIFEGPGISIFPFVLRSPHRRNPLFFHSFEHVESNTTIVFEDPYSDHTEEFPLNDEPELFNYFARMRTTLGLESVTQGYLCLFGDDYNHIKNLAWAVSSFGGGYLDQFIKNYKLDHIGIPEDLEAVDLVTLAIADLGPTHVLRTLLRSNRGLLEDYLRYLEKRTLVSAREYLQAFDEQKKEKEVNAAPFLALDEQLKEKVLEDIDLEARCWCLMKASGLNIEAPRDYVESIGMRLKIIGNLQTKFMKREIAKETVVINIAKLVERTFRFLICFYSGLGSYYESFRDNERNFERHEERMFLAAREAYDRLAKGTPGTLIDEFTKLCALMNTGVVKELLGRRRICDVNKFNTLVERNKKDGWISIFNRLKHDRTKLVLDSLNTAELDISLAECANFIGKTSKLFRFLRHGRELTDTQEAMMNIGEPVYPRVVSFREQHRKRDGFSVYNYRVHSLDGMSADELEDIKILTSREQMSSEEYYCMPCQRKAASDWWLDPFLVRCSTFHGLSNEPNKEGGYGQNSRGRRSAKTFEDCSDS